MPVTTVSRWLVGQGVEEQGMFPFLRTAALPAVYSGADPSLRRSAHGVGHGGRLLNTHGRVCGRWASLQCKVPLCSGCWSGHCESHALRPMSIAGMHALVSHVPLERACSRGQRILGLWCRSAGGPASAAASQRERHAPSVPFLMASPSRRRLQPIVLQSIGSPVWLTTFAYLCTLLNAIPGYLVRAKSLSCLATRGTLFVALCLLAGTKWRLHRAA